MPVIIPADDLSEVVRIRHELHTVPCLSNEELPTATTLLSVSRRQLLESSGVSLCVTPRSTLWRVYR
jgi:metal-dependent amidase/aminoacylase/carboxypeptidase family protein